MRSKKESRGWCGTVQLSKEKARKQGAQSTEEPGEEEGGNLRMGGSSVEPSEEKAGELGMVGTVQANEG